MLRCLTLSQREGLAAHPTHMLRNIFATHSFTRCAKQQIRLRPSQTIFTRGLRTSLPRQNQYIRFSDPPPPRGDGSGHNKPPPNDRLDWRRWDPRVRFGMLTIGLGGIYYVAHLEQVPQTGRWRFMNTSSETEAMLGEATRKELKRDLADKILPPNHRTSILVRRVASRILKHSQLGHIHGDHTPTSQMGFGDDEIWHPADDYGAAARNTYGPAKEWDVVVVNDNHVVNAMATPGLILVFTGILPVCQDEQGLAAVLSHEIGHVVARHTAERISSQVVFFGIVFVLQVFGLDWGFSHMLKKFLLELPNSRTQELEADVIGLRLMSRACYDPTASPQMFERLGQLESKMGSRANLDFFQTHPSSERRVKQLQEALPEAFNIVAANPECSTLRDQLEQFRDHLMKPIRRVV